MRRGKEAEKRGGCGRAAAFHRTEVVSQAEKVEGEERGEKSRDQFVSLSLSRFWCSITVVSPQESVDAAAEAGV